MAILISKNVDCMEKCNARKKFNNNKGVIHHEDIITQNVYAPRKRASEYQKS